MQSAQKIPLPLCFRPVLFYFCFVNLHNNFLSACTGCRFCLLTLNTVLTFAFHFSTASLSSLFIVLLSNKKEKEKKKSTRLVSVMLILRPPTSVAGKSLTRNRKTSCSGLIEDISVIVRVAMGVYGHFKL